MRLTLPKINWPTWSRTSQGNNYYDITDKGNWLSYQSNLHLAQNHPILTPALLFVSKLFSQGSFEIVNSSTGSVKNKGLILDLLENPNIYQTKEDFLETLMFMMLAQGVAVVAMNRIIGFDDPDSMFILNYDLIEWPENFSASKFRKNSSAILDKSIIYDKDGENITYKISDLMFFYDSPNAISKNPFKVVSRIEGLKQTLINTQDSLIAKNIILKSNGKEMITGKKGGFPMTPEEKQEVEDLFNKKIGLSFNRKRGVVTKADLSWKSLHIALRDLGLDESTKVDGNIVYTALHIPKDILSLEAKKTTYNNFKESMVSYIQNEMQPSLNSFCSVLNKSLSNGNSKIRGNFDHLQIMQYILLEKYEVVKKQAEALALLRNAGVPDQLALKMCGLPEDTKLGPMTQQNLGNNDEESEDNKTQLQKVWGRKQA